MLIYVIRHPPSPPLQQISPYCSLPRFLQPCSRRHKILHSSRGEAPSQERWRHRSNEWRNIQASKDSAQASRSPGFRIRENVCNLSCDSGSSESYRHSRPIDANSHLCKPGNTSEDWGADSGCAGCSDKVEGQRWVGLCARCGEEYKI